MSETHVTIKVPKELVDEMDKLQGKHGFRSRGEIAKEAIRQFLEKYEKETLSLPRFEKINNDESGIKILDRTIHKVVEVYVKPTGIQCSYDQTEECEHVTFALSFPEVKALVKRHRKEGWKLPNL